MGTINAQYPFCKSKAEAISHLSFHQSLPCQKHKLPSAPGILRVVGATCQSHWRQNLLPFRIDRSTEGDKTVMARIARKVFKTRNLGHKIKLTQ